MFFQARLNPETKKDIMLRYGLSPKANYYDYKEENGVFAFKAFHNGLLINTHYVCSLQPHRKNENEPYIKIEKQNCECNESAAMCGAFLSASCFLYSAALSLSNRLKK